MTGPAVTVIIDGRPVTGSVSAVLAGGSVMAPIDPYLKIIAARILLGDDRGTLTFERGGRRVTVNVPLLRDGAGRIPLAPAARALGAAVHYDGATKTLSIASPAEPLATMTPYAGWTPPPGPLPTFTPTSTPTPRPSVTGIPQPRRTPVLVTTPL